MILLDGKICAKHYLDRLQPQIAELKLKHSLTPTLATILVGEDIASQIYVGHKIKTAQKVGLNSLHYSLKSDVTEAELFALIQSLNQNPDVHGILVQLPLPKHLTTAKVLELICPEKDVDGFHPVNRGRLVTGDPCFAPCTPLGVMKLLEFYNISVAGLNVLVLGRSNIVGKPMAALLLEKNATVTIAHSCTKNLDLLLLQADLVVAAIGKPKFILASWLKKDCVVIDVGINRLPDGKLCGDVDFSNAQNQVRAITPVPGGVGPMTIAMLMNNTLQACQKQIGESHES